MINYVPFVGQHLLPKTRTFRSAFDINEDETMIVPNYFRLSTKRDDEKMFLRLENLATNFILDEKLKESKFEQNHCQIICAARKQRVEKAKKSRVIAQRSIRFIGYYYFDTCIFACCRSRR